MKPMVQTDEEVRKLFAARLALACKNAGMDNYGRGTELAKALKVTSKAVSKWFNAESMPRQSKIDELAKYLKVDVAWLQLGISEDGKDGELVRRVGYSYEYPLFDTRRLAEVYGDKKEPLKSDAMRLIETSKKASDKAFWLIVSGDSMTSQGGGISFPSGILILIEPLITPAPGDFCAVYLEDEKQVTFKRFIIDAGTQYLQSLNSGYKLTVVKDCYRFIGVVIASKWEILR